MIKELENKIGQLQYEISLLGHSEEDLTGVTIRTDELKDLVKNSSIHDVVASLPSRLEMNNQSEKEFKEMKLIANKVMYKHFRLGFSTCYEWMLYVLNNKG